MECERVQAAISARLDGERPGLSDDVVADHLRRCVACRTYAAAVEAHVRPGGPVPVPTDGIDGVDGTAGTDAVERTADDVRARVVGAAGEIDRSGVWWVLRALLFLVACGYLITAVPELLFSSDPHHGHLAHHLGAFEAAYGVGLIFVAARPAKARAMVPFTATLAVGMGVMAVVDIYRGEAFPLSELSHVLEIAGLVLVWMLATRRGWPRRSDDLGAPMGAGHGPTSVPTRPPLAVAPDPDGPRRSQRAS